MDLSEEQRQEPPESVIPMINVVFLLLIFFLISATLSPPVEAEPPISALAGEPADPAALVIDKDGVAAFGEQRGEAAVEAAAQAFDKKSAEPMALLADAGAPGAALARTMRSLAALGVRHVALTTIQGESAQNAVRECQPQAVSPC